MFPLLYQSESPLLSPDSMVYIGRLPLCTKCTVSEQLNGDYQLSAAFLPNEELIDEVQNQRFLTAKPNPFDPPQYFEIYNCSFDEVGRLAVSGRHIKHCSYNNVLVDFSVTQPEATPLEHWTNMQNLFVFDNYFVFDSDINVRGKIETGWTKAGTLGMFFDELSSVFGGEYHYDNFNVDLLTNRGAKKNYALRWNQNIGSPKLNLSTADIYSHVVAVADVTIYQDSNKTVSYQSVSYSNVYPIQNSTSKLTRVYLLDANDQIPKKEIVWTSEEDKYAVSHALDRAAYGFSRLFYKDKIQYTENVNLRVNYRPALDEMKEIALGDTLDVVLKGGRTVEAKITKTEFDSLAERWTAIELGKEKLKLSNYIARR